MKKAFQVNTPYNISQTSLVIAESMCEAEKIFQHKYQGTRINSIELVSTYVLDASDLKE